MGWKTRIELALGEPQSPVLTITPLPPNGTPSGIRTHILRFRRPPCSPLHHRRIWLARRYLKPRLDFRRILCYPLHHARIGGIEGNWTLITSMANWSTHHCTTTPYGGCEELRYPDLLLKRQLLFRWATHPCGGPGGPRSHSLWFKRPVLCQLSYRPIWRDRRDLNSQLSDWKSDALANCATIPYGGTYRIRTGVTAIPMPYTWPTILTHHKSRYSPLYSLQIPQTPHLSSRRSTRFVGQGMEVRQGFEPWFEHYKCPVITIILSHHMEARVDHDSTPVDYETTILPTYTISPNGAGGRYRPCLDFHPTSV